MKFTPMLAELSGEGMVQNLKYFLIIGVCLLLLWWLGKWLCGVFEAPAIALKGWTVVFVVMGVFVLINFLLGFVGYPFIRW
jgi:hypothetical protein